MIYEPAEDSYLIEKYVRKYAQGRVLDMGTGSGILALAALEKTNDVLASDINKEAVEYCKKKEINAIVSDLFKKISGKFDLIIFNPPYLPKDKKEDKESRVATTGGRRGNEILNRFLKSAGEYLTEDGKILIVVSSLTPDIEKLIKKYGFNFRLLEKEKIFFEELKVYLINR